MSCDRVAATVYRHATPRASFRGSRPFDGRAISIAPAGSYRRRASQCMRGTRAHSYAHPPLPCLTLHRNPLTIQTKMRSQMSILLSLVEADAGGNMAELKLVHFPAHSLLPSSLYLLC